MCFLYWWCTKHAQLIMGTWPIYQKNTSYNWSKQQKNFHLIKYLLTTFISFLSFQSVLVTSCVVPDISWKFHENPFARYPMIFTNKHGSIKYEIRSRIQGVNPKCPWVFLASCSTFPKIFMKICSFVFSVMLLTDTDCLENIQKETQYTKG